MHVWRAFEALSTCRPLGFGAVGPIPWTATDRYLTVNGYADEDYQDTMELIGAMDAAYLRLTSEKRSGDD